MTVQLDAWESPLLLQAYAPWRTACVTTHSFWLTGRNRAGLPPRQVITREHSHTFFLPPPSPARSVEAIRALYAFVASATIWLTAPAAIRLPGCRSGGSAALRPASADDPVALAWADARARFAIPRQLPSSFSTGSPPT